MFSMALSRNLTDPRTKTFSSKPLSAMRSRVRIEIERRFAAMALVMRDSFIVVLVAGAFMVILGCFNAWSGRVQNGISPTVKNRTIFITEGMHRFIITSASSIRVFLKSTQSLIVNLLAGDDFFPMSGSVFT